ncbi:MAG: hypothetical protein KY395_05090 [Actinobacteria bacterium]|nr:hypothetical protein [Actinomycetota bacterium]
MKNPVLRALLLGAAVGGLLIGATPAQAATVQWEDDAGDAALSVLPSEAYDITTVKLSNDGGNVTWEVSVPEMADGTPSFSTGYTFRLLFTHGDVGFRFQVAENLLGEQDFRVSLASGTLPPPALECEGCEGAIDREAKKVTVKAPIASLDKALQSAEGPPLAGAEWTALSVVAYRPASAPNPGSLLPASGILFTNDTAAAPEGTTLAF